MEPATKEQSKYFHFLRDVICKADGDMSKLNKENVKLYLKVKTAKNGWPEMMIERFAGDYSLGWFAKEFGLKQLTTEDASNLIAYTECWMSHPKRNIAIPYYDGEKE